VPEIVKREAIETSPSSPSSIRRRSRPGPVRVRERASAPDPCGSATGRPSPQLGAGTGRRRLVNGGRTARPRRFAGAPSRTAPSAAYSVRHRRPPYGPRKNSKLDARLPLHGGGRGTGLARSSASGQGPSLFFYSQSGDDVRPARSIPVARDRLSAGRDAGRTVPTDPSWNTDQGV